MGDVKEVLELYLYLNMSAYLGELERVTSFKEKARKQPDIVNKIAPIRERIVEFSSNTELLKKIAKEGADKARESAAKTLKEVQQIIGFTNI